MAPADLLQFPYLAYALVPLLAYLVFWREQDSLSHIPTIGVPVAAGPLGKYIASVLSISKTREWLDEGARKYPSGVFKIRTLYGWIVVVSGTTQCNELAKAPDDVLSFQEAATEAIEADYTLSGWRDAASRPEVHIGLIRGKLTRSLGSLFPAVYDEIRTAFEDVFKLPAEDETGWTPLVARDALMRVICRTTNRVFVGLPLCRNEEFVDLNVRFTMDVAMSAFTIKLFPTFLKPLVGRYLTPMRRAYRDGERLMRDFVEERLRETASHEGKEWAEKPDDLLQWMIDLANERELQPDFLIKQILRLNFSAIHTTLISIMHAFYHIAASPESYQTPLRKEVLHVISTYGWTKDAMDRLVKLDSILRESQRHFGLGALSMPRKALKGFTFSADGTHVDVPAGTTLAVSARAIHFDEGVYECAEEFRGFRFAQDDSDEGGARYVNASASYVPWGYGRHACPGRFWAANEMKAVLAYLLAHYDFRLEDQAVPKETWFGHNVVPHQTAKVLFRRRA
ncbi:cytochrome P450 [Exidia glandulosa HHB12029]|uniref:Cytochrome P450 n=1 Tax=Exidia glandulosa HHB12029 TaxID=1314781 RepID=A0A165Z6C1_EXIGL|nr:cytochrome P450 [Exidia glandulosa HHB12029]